MILRDARPADAEAVAAIYGHHILNSLGTFEERPPDAAEMARRMQAVATLDLPYLVAEEERRIVGFAYGSAFRPRTGYRYTVEDSVYVAPDRVGRGLGKALLGALIDRCEALGLRQMVAVIGDSANAASLGLHRACGFRQVGGFSSIGFKFGRWVDVVFMQRPLNDGGTAGASGSEISINQIHPGFEPAAADLRQSTRGRRQTSSENLRREGRDER